MSETPRNRCLVLSIGNTDNKLSQQDWNRFVAAMDGVVNKAAKAVHFFGGPSTWMKWQNVAWIAEIQDEDTHIAMSRLMGEVRELREEFGQDSVMIIFSKPHFI